MPSDKQLDEILDRALARYSEAEPLAGLEDRVLQRVRTAHAGAQRSKNVGWVWAAACIAALAAAALVLEIKPTTPPRQPELTKAISPAIVPLKGVSPRPILRRVARRRVTPRQLPKQKDFPARTPMTAEERALVRLVSRSPEMATSLLAGLDKNDTPIQIEPIQIAPLKTDDSNEPY